MNHQHSFTGKLLTKTLSVTLAVTMLLSMVMIGNVFGTTAFAAESFDPSRAGVTPPPQEKIFLLLPAGNG